MRNYRPILSPVLSCVALLLCASCSSQKSQEPTASASLTQQPKAWTGPATPEHPLPPIRESEKRAFVRAPATEPGDTSISIPSNAIILKPATRPAEPAVTVAPRPAPPVKPKADELEQPGQDNTGVADQKNLKISQKIVAKDGQVIENLFITGGIMANGTKEVVIRNCLIDGGGTRYGLQCQDAQNLLIEHCEIYNVTNASVYGEGFTAKWNNLYQSGGDGFKPGDNSVIQSNWVHALGWKNPTSHSDGVQIRGSKNIHIFGNYFDMATDVPDTKSNSSLFATGFKGRNPATDILFERNWCRGGNFTIHATSDGGDASTIRIINNRFMQGSARFGCGMLEAGVLWKDNVFDATGTPAQPNSK